MAIIKKYSLPRITPIPGGITQAGGFKAGGVRSGIKVSGAEDLAMLVSETDCAAAGVFTTNAIRASSVNWCDQHLPSGKIRAVVCNSGCANACTGVQGEKDTRSVAELACSAFNLPADSVLVASTGVIGKFLPLDKVSTGLRKLGTRVSDRGGALFARSIMTTDTRKKEAAVRVTLSNGTITIGGCCKGSGMICPNMATMLAFITTDAKIAATQLSAILKRVADRTFNTLTVDGDTSTNDMVLALANGSSTIEAATKADRTAFEEGLFIVCNDLCKKIAADGEGATKRIEIAVSGAASEDDATKAARAVANSNLTKCAIFGNDPNWGRIACAVGYSGASFSNETMTILLQGTPVFKNLQPVPFDAKRLSKLLKKKVVKIGIDLGRGNKSAIAHTCDFSYDYVRINAEYHT